MKTNITQVNPAALLGYGLPGVTLAAGSSSDLTFSARRYGTSSSSMYVQIGVKDPSLYQLLSTSPLLAGPHARMGGKAGSRHHIHAKLAYGPFMRLLGLLKQAGFTFDSELANHQADTAASGVSLEVQAAYDQFKADASTFLQRVQALGLTTLGSRKGIHQVDNPFLAIALGPRSAAVLVSPDAYDARYVYVTVRGNVPASDVLTIRNLAYEHYEGLGLRLHFAGL